MADGLEVLTKLRDTFCERPFRDEDARALLSNSKLLGCLLTQLEEDRAAVRSRAIRPVPSKLASCRWQRIHIHMIINHIAADAPKLK